MAVKQAKGAPCPDPLVLDETTLTWFGKRYPQVDPEIAVERYSAWAVSGGYLYCNHLKALQNYVIREADNNKLTPMLKRVEQKADRGQALIEKARSIGFREPHKGETHDAYEIAMKSVNRVIDVRNVFKRI